MAYITNNVQKRRGEDGAATDGGGTSTSSQTPVSAPEKQDSTAKTPIRAQVEANKGFSQEAAINRVYKPFEQEVGTRKADYQDQQQNYLGQEAQKTQGFNIADDEIKQQVGRGQLTGNLSKVLGGYNETFGPGDLNIKQAPIAAAKELSGRNATTSLMNSSSGTYGRGMASLDNALLRSSGGIGQLGQKIGQGTNELRQYGLGLGQQGKEQATAERQAQIADTQGRLKGNIGSVLSAKDQEATQRNAARLARETGEREAAKDPGKAAIQKALMDLELTNTQGFEGRLQDEYKQLQGLDLNQFLDQDVRNTGQYSQFSADELGYVNALRGMLGQSGVEAGDAGDQNFGFDQGRLGQEIARLTGAVQGRKGEKVKGNNTARFNDYAARYAMDPRTAGLFQGIDPANFTEEEMAKLAAAIDAKVSGAGAVAANEYDTQQGIMNEREAFGKPKPPPIPKFVTAPDNTVPKFETFAPTSNEELDFNARQASVNQAAAENAKKMQTRPGPAPQPPAPVSAGTLSAINNATGAFSQPAAKPQKTMQQLIAEMTNPKNILPSWLKL